MHNLYILSLTYPTCAMTPLSVRNMKQVSLAVLLVCCAMGHAQASYRALDGRTDAADPAAAYATTANPYFATTPNITVAFPNGSRKPTRQALNALQDFLNNLAVGARLAIVARTDHGKSKTLVEQRATAVRDALLGMGISGSRLALSVDGPAPTYDDGTTPPYVRVFVMPAAIDDAPAEQPAVVQAQQNTASDAAAAIASAASSKRGKDSDALASSDVRVQIANKLLSINAQGKLDAQTALNLIQAFLNPAAQAAPTQPAAAPNVPSAQAPGNPPARTTSAEIPSYWQDDARNVPSRPTDPYPSVVATPPVTWPHNAPETRPSSQSDRSFRATPVAASEQRKPTPQPSRRSAPAPTSDSQDDQQIEAFAAALEALPKPSSAPLQATDSTAQIARAPRKTAAHTWTPLTDDGQTVPAKSQKTQTPSTDTAVTSATTPIAGATPLATTTIVSAPLPSTSGSTVAPPVNKGALIKVSFQPSGPPLLPTQLSTAAPVAPKTGATASAPDESSASSVIATAPPPATPSSSKMSASTPAAAPSSSMASDNQPHVKASTATAPLATQPVTDAPTAQPTNSNAPAPETLARAKPQPTPSDFSAPSETASPKWDLDPSKTLKENLDAWAARANYHVQWRASNYIKVSTARHYTCEFLEAVSIIAQGASAIVNIDTWPQDHLIKVTDK